jgi:PAS domain S-box-containing protein
VNSISILIVEDSPLDAELVLAQLRREQISPDALRVTSTKELREALEGDRSFDVILSDFSLPSFSGSEALEMAKQIRPGVPFIFVSGALGEEVAIELLKRGATDYVLKHRLERLCPAVRRALSEAEERRRREAAEGKLRESEQRYRLLAEASPQFVWAMNSEGQVTYVNQQLCEYTGVSAERVTSGEWRSFIHPEDVDSVHQTWERAAGQCTPCGFEYRVWSQLNGTYKWHLARMAPICDEEGHVLQWLGTAIEIDAQKRAEQALRRSNEELQQFAFAASHDLQEPLRNISTFTQLLAQRFKDSLDEEAREYVGYAVEGAKRMNVLIQDLLAYARIATQEVPNQRIEMGEALESALSSLRTAITESEAVITHDLLPEVCANQLQLSQVLQNLLSNAIKYRNRDRTPKIHIGVAKMPGEWVFTISDNGQGFDPVYANRIFGVFHRLHGRDVPGTGIGLSLCKRIVERHGGRIWAKSTPGHGSTFSFSLPFLSAPTADEQQVA